MPIPKDVLDGRVKLVFAKLSAAKSTSEDVTTNSLSVESIEIVANCLVFSELRLARGVYVAVAINSKLLEIVLAKASPKLNEKPPIFERFTSRLWYCSN